MLKIGDYVSRKKYGNDIIFKIVKIIGNKVYLVGVDVRLCADSTKDDLVLTAVPKKKQTISFVRELKTDSFFYITPTIVHVDADVNYMNQCKNFYEEQKIKSHVFCYTESEMSNHVLSLVKKYSPNILVITGHDAYYKQKKNNFQYKNTKYFVDCVKKVRNLVKNHEDLIIIAGACQSDYELLIKSGATYASSPKRVNIHALDPAIVASSIALTDSSSNVDIEETLNKTHYKESGMGGIITKGKLLVGYPRKEI